MLAFLRVSIYKTETGCKAGDKCLFPHHRVDEQPKQKATERLLFPKEERATTRMLCLLWKLYHNWVASRKTRMHWFLIEENSLGETRCKKSWDQFEKYGWLSLRYVKQVSRKRRDHRLEKYKSWHVRTGPMKRLKDNSDVPEARHGTLPETYTSSKNEATFHLPAKEWVLPAASTKEPEEREFAVDSGTSAHIVSKRDLDSAELETMRTSRSPTTVMTTNGEVQAREEATVYVKVVTGMLLEETPAVLSPREALRGSWVFCSPKRSIELIAIYPTIYHLWFLNCQRVHLLLHHLHHRILYLTLADTRKSSTRKKWKYEWRASGRPAAWTERNRKQ